MGERFVITAPFRLPSNTALVREGDIYPGPVRKLQVCVYKYAVKQEKGPITCYIISWLEVNIKRLIKHIKYIKSLGFFFFQIATSMLIDLKNPTVLTLAY